MTTANPKWLNGLMLILGISLIQWHSIQFWMDATGFVGPLWSLAIEGAALWLWWQRRLLLASCASLIVLAGPLFHLTHPLYEATQLALQKQQEVLEKKVIIQSSIDQLTSALESYQTTSQTRVGWAARIDETQDALKMERDRFEKLVSTQTSHNRNDLPLLTALIETLAISILMLTQILAIHKFRELPVNRNADQKVETTRSEKPNKSGGSVSTSSNSLNITDQNLDSHVSKVSTQLAEILKVEKMSQSEWGRRNGVSKKSISMLLNHSKRRQEGKELISKNELKHVYEQIISIDT